MSRSKQSCTTRAKAPTSSALLRALGQPPLLRNEKEAEFNALLEQFYAAIDPSDAVEEMYTYDLVCNLWEARRIRAYKAKFVDGNLHQSLRFFLQELNYGVLRIDSAVSGWRKKDPESREAVECELSSAGVNEDHLIAQTAAIHIDTIEKFDRMLHSCERRRVSLLQEVDRRRHSFAERARAASRTIDADYSEVAT